MTLSRLISPPWMFFGECMTSWSTPSTRNRTRTSRSVGSIWTSDARSPTAWVMIAWTSLTIGASSSADSSCSSSVSSCSDACDRKGFDLAVHAGELLDRLLDVGGGRHHRLHVAVRDRADVVQRVHVRGVRHRDQELAVAFADRDRAVAARERVRQQHRGRRVDVVVGQVDELQPDLLGQGAHQVRLLDQPEIDQDATERLGGLAMLFERLLQLRRRDETLFDQDLSQLFRLALDRSHVGLPASVRSRSSGTSFVITALNLKQPRKLFGQHDRIHLGVGVELHRSGRVRSLAVVCAGTLAGSALVGVRLLRIGVVLRFRAAGRLRCLRVAAGILVGLRLRIGGGAICRVASPDRPTPLTTFASSSVTASSGAPSVAGGVARDQWRASALSGAGADDVGFPFGDGRIEDCGFAGRPPDASGTRSVSRRFRDSSAEVRMPSSWSITSPGRMPALATAKAPYAGRLTYTQT